MQVLAIGDLVSKETVCCVGGKVKHEGLRLETSVFESYTVANLPSVDLVIDTLLIM